MKKTMKRVFALILVVMFWAMLIPAAFAEGEVEEPAAPEEPTMTPSVTVPVEVKLTGTLPPQKEKFVIHMLAEDSSFPLPEGAADGEATIIIEGAGTGEFADITFDRVGVYNYYIWQDPGAKSDAKYDQTIYCVVITITNNADYTGLVATMALHLVKVDKESDEIKFADEKPEQILFINRYKFIPPKTGDDSNVAQYLTLCGLSALAIGAVLVLKKKLS